MTHVWRVSRAADRVMAQVAGLPPEKARKRLFVNLQAYIDESAKDGILVLGGYIGTAESWANFSREWERLLPRFGTLSDDNVYHFKMSEMAMTEDRMARVPVFFRVIEEHVIGWISVKLSLEDFKRGMDRIVIEDGYVEDWGKLANPYIVCFRALVDEFHYRRSEMAEALPQDQKVDFYFDKRMEAKHLQSFWHDYVAKRPNDIRRFYGSAPRFEDDREYLPLQAADFWAWWVRKWYAQGTPDKIDKLDFGRFTLTSKKPFLRVHGPISENDVARFLLGQARDRLPQDVVVYDSKKARDA